MNPDDELVLIAVGAWLLVLAVFALPTIVAFRRGDPNRWLILAFNASVVGWVVALGLAVYPMIRWVPPGSADAGEAARLPSEARLGLPLSPQAGAGERLSSAAAVAEIERLGRLQADGHLSGAEFAALKAKVLNRL